MARGVVYDARGPLSWPLSGSGSREPVRMERQSMRDSPLDRAAETPQQTTGRIRLAKADVHIHTNLGDGMASPQRVIAEAKRRGMRVFAVTDHDHMEGAKRIY